MSWDDPPYPPSQKKYQVDSKVKDKRESIMIKKKVINNNNNPNLLDRSGSGSTPQGVKKVSHLGPKFHILIRNRFNTIPWASPN